MNTNIPRPKDDRFVIFATPTLDRRFSAEFILSWTRTVWLLCANGIAHKPLIVGGDPYLAKARNRLATLALNDDQHCTDLFFLDDDIGWEPEAVLRFLARPEGLVCGVYPKKQDEPAWPCELLRHDKTGALIERNGLYLAASAPTGFMRIKREALEACKEISLEYDDATPTGIERCYNIFEMGMNSEDGKWWGEDHAFCQKWRSLGGEVWVDPDVHFTHRGTKAWTGTFADPIAAYVPPTPVLTEV